MVERGTLHAGAPGNWQLIAQLVADGAVTLDTNAGTEIALESLDSPVRTDAGLHAFYLPPSIFVKAEGVKCHMLAIFDTPGVYPTDAVYAGLVRNYLVGPPAKAPTSLHIRNMTAASQTVFYRVYKWRGLT